MRRGKIGKRISILCSVCGFLAVIIFRRNLAAEYALIEFIPVLKRLFIPAPNNATDLLALFYNHPIIALIITNFFDLVNSILVFVLQLPVYAQIKQKSFTAFCLAVISSITACVLYFISTSSIKLTFLSYMLYSGGGSKAHKEAIIKEAENCFTVHHSIISFNSITGDAALFFLFFSGMVVSMSIIKNKLFTPLTGIIGLIAHGTVFFYFPLRFILPDAVFIPMSFSAPFIVLWYFMIARSLLTADIVKQKDLKLKAAYKHKVNRTLR